MSTPNLVANGKLKQRPDRKMKKTRRKIIEKRYISEKTIRRIISNRCMTRRRRRGRSRRRRREKRRMKRYIRICVWKEEEEEEEEKLENKCPPHFTPILTFRSAPLALKFHIFSLRHSAGHPAGCPFAVVERLTCLLFAGCAKASLLAAKVVCAGTCA